MLIPFNKVQAQANDFAVFDLLPARESNLDLKSLAIAMCDRRMGVGADGLVVLLAHPEADARMLIFNSDGSRAAMCGSALRCCVSLLAKKLNKDTLRIFTDSGMRSGRLLSGQAGGMVEVDMGSPRTIESDLDLGYIRGHLVDVGNLHLVCAVDDLHGQEHSLGPRIEREARFPGGVNVEFVVVKARHALELTVWERGAGATQACGTGAVAATFALGGLGETGPEAVEVKMPGGVVSVSRGRDGSFRLAGKAEIVFNGVYIWKT